MKTQTFAEWLADLKPAFQLLGLVCALFPLMLLALALEKAAEGVQGCILYLVEIGDPLSEKIKGGRP